MVNKSNLKVFCFLRINECIISSICFVFHIFEVVATDEDTFKNEMVFRIIYFCFVIYSAFCALGHIHDIFNYKVEAVSAIVGFLYYILTSMWSMVIVEMDEHLQYLTEFEEYHHYFFQMNRFQSVLTLLAGILFLLHATFAIDLMLNKPLDDEEEVTSEWPRVSDAPSNSNDLKPLQLHLFTEKIFMVIFRRHHPQ